MKITTKYNIDDKVWFYIEEINQYVWGKIVSLDISVRIDKPYITYHIENRFYKDNYDFCWERNGDWKSSFIFNFPENEVFNSPEGLIAWLNKKHSEKMGQLKELKKGFWI